MKTVLWQKRRDDRIPLLLKIAFTAMACVIVPIYWRDLGPANFLWFSDIALITMVPALWLESRLWLSTMAVAVFMLECSWIVDFLLGGELTGLAAYMFDGEDPHISWLSGTFHWALPATLLFTLIRLGYDERAYALQCLLAVIVLPLTWLLTGPAENINWVYGPAQPQSQLPPLVYLGLLTASYCLLVYLPSHLVFSYVFGKRSGRRQPGN